MASLLIYLHNYHTNKIFPNIKKTEVIIVTFYILNPLFEHVDANTHRAYIVVSLRMNSGNLFQKGPTNHIHKLAISMLQRDL